MARKPKEAVEETVVEETAFGEETAPGGETVAEDQDGFLIAMLGEEGYAAYLRGVAATQLRAVFFGETPADDAAYLQDTIAKLLAYTGAPAGDA